MFSTIMFSSTWMQKSAYMPGSRCRAARVSTRSCGSSLRLLPRVGTRLLVLFCILASFALAAPLPTPEQFAGNRMGTDKKLLRWDKIVEYAKLAAASSPRIKFEEMGKTSMGNPFVTVTDCPVDEPISPEHEKRARAHPVPRFFSSSY